MSGFPFQDQYQEARADCWGCGRNNPEGLFIKSYWEGDEAVAHYEVLPHQIGHKGVMNGGVIATLIDCHSIGLAIAHAHREAGREIGTSPLITYVTGSLHVDYLKPTPVNDKPVELRARIKSVDGRKSLVTCSLYAGSLETARGEVLGIRVDKLPSAAP